MNKNILYIGIAVLIGLLGGWLLFGDAASTSQNSDSAAHDHAGDSAEQMWTCSMHPQILQPEPGDCPICGMDLILADTGAEGLAVNEIKMTENAVALANINTSIVGSSSASDNNGSISLSGKIAANEENNTIQSSYFDGRIERLNVNYEGQKVTVGQLLGTIYSPTLVAAQQELITAASLKEAQPALYNAVRNKLKNWKLSNAQIDAIEASGQVRENFPMYATLSGTVSEVLAREGDYVKQGQAILKVSNLNTVWAEFDAYESQISTLKEGQKVTIVPNAYPNREFTASISFIDPMLNDASRTVTVRATLTNTDNLFKPGMFVTGKLQETAVDLNEIITIPASAVLWTGERSLVYIKTNPGQPIFEMREVTIGSRLGDEYTITNGLTNGDEIVTNGTFTVDAAAQLQGKKSMMNPGKQTNTDLPLTQMRMEFHSDFQENFKTVLNAYLKMKDAFVASDAQQITTFAKEALNALNSMKFDELGNMENAHIKKSIEMLRTIAENDNLENQRAHFVLLNENIVPIALNVQALGTELYVQKCPMANKNKGAVWLSTEKDIQNPYYGEQMLSCGSIIETIE